MVIAVAASGCGGIPISDGPLQRIVIHGVVLDAQSGRPIAGARVSGSQGRVDRPDTDVVPISTLSDVEGKFRVAGYGPTKRFFPPRMAFEAKSCGAGDFTVEKEG